MHGQQISGNCNEVSPIFVDTLGILLVGYGSIVQCISMETGELIGSFSQHKRLVSSLQYTSVMGSTTKDVAISASLDGEIFVWSIKDFHVINKFIVDTPIYDILLPDSLKNSKLFLDKSSIRTTTDRGNDELVLVVGKKSSITAASNNASNKECKVVIYDIAADKVRRRVSSVRSAKHCVGTLVVGNEEYLMIGTKRSIMSYSLHTRQHGPKITTNTGSITCITTCQATGVVITGHEKGEITVWHNMPQWIRSNALVDNDESASYDPPVSTIWHWHAHAVQDLQISLDGNYLYSGGDEAVLVMWQMQTGIKAFVPRLGGAIAFVGCSRNSSKVAVATMDNSIHFIDTVRLREEWALRAMFLTTNGGASTHSSNSSDLNYVENFLQSDPNFRCSVKIEPVHGYISCNGYPGQLQTLQLGHRGIRETHDIAVFTRVSRTEAKTKMYVPSVSLFDYAMCGTKIYLATLDVRRGEDKESVSSLKFWTWNESKASYRLLAQVEHPHGQARINTLSVFAGAASLGEAVCVTGSSDGNVKIWKASIHHSSKRDAADQSSQQDKERLSWTCFCSFSHKDSPVTACSFSADANLLAIAQENIISIWDPISVSLRATLAAPYSNSINFLSFLEPRSSLEYGGGSGQAYIVAGSNSTLCLFDLLSLRLRWCAQGKFNAFAVASSELEAVFSESGDELLYIAASAIHSTNGEADKVLNSCKVCLFSLNSPVPVDLNSISSNAVSMCFTSGRGRRDASTHQAGLVCVTEGSELVFFTREPFNEHYDKQLPSKMSVTSLPALPTDLSDAKVSSRSLREELTSPGVAHTRRDDAVRQLFGESSEEPPIVSTLSASFLGTLLRASSVTKTVDYNETVAGDANKVMLESNTAEDDDDDDNDDDAAKVSSPRKNAEEDVMDIQEESRVFLKRGRSRSMSFEARDGVLGDPTQVELLEGKLAIFSESMKSISENATAEYSQKSRETTGGKHATDDPDTTQTKRSRAKRVEESSLTSLPAPKTTSRSVRSSSVTSNISVASSVGSESRPRRGKAPASVLSGLSTTAEASVTRRSSRRS